MNNFHPGVDIVDVDRIKSSIEKYQDKFLSKVYEVHHKNKIDYPSGTALMLGEGIAAGKNKKLFENFELWAQAHVQALRTRVLLRSLSGHKSSSRPRSSSRHKSSRR